MARDVGNGVSECEILLGAAKGDPMVLGVLQALVRRLPDAFLRVCLDHPEELEAKLEFEELPPADRLAARDRLIDLVQREYDSRGGHYAH